MLVDDKARSDNVILLKEVVKDIVKNDEIVVDINNAKRLTELRRISLDVQNQFNVITSTILNMAGAIGNYNTIFDNDGRVKLVKIKEEEEVKVNKA